MTQQTSNHCGIAAVLVAVTEWILAIHRIRVNPAMATFLGVVFAPLFFAALVLPILAAIKSSKLWLLLLLSPIAMYCAAWSF